MGGKRLKDFGIGSDNAGLARENTRVKSCSILGRGLDSSLPSLFL